MSGRRIDRLQSQIDSLQRELARISSLPEDDFEDHAVIMFEKKFGGSPAVYTYVALKAGRRWHLTGKAGNVGPKTWDELCEFIGDFDLADVWYATEWERV